MLSERVFSRTEPVTESGCWLWLGPVNWAGYGRATFCNKSRSVHRVSWEVTYGSIPIGLCVLHKCDVPCCINPSHLFLGTMRDNFHDMVRKGRQKLTPPAGERNGHAKLTTTEVLEIRALADSGWSNESLMEKFSIKRSQIHAIRHRYSWSHL